MSDRPAFTLRQLPLPAKWVVSAFLMAVGVGYFSALVQIHMQHTGRDGQAMPTPENMIEKFSGLKKWDGSQPQSRLEAILAGPPDGSFDKNNMTPAFYAKSSGYDKECAADSKGVVDNKRAGERLAMLAWMRAEPAERRKAFDDDAYTPDAARFPAGTEVTDDFYDADKKTVAIRSIIESRCTKCHGGSQQPEMNTYEQIAPLATAPELKVLDGGWVASPRKLSVESLTQSTHAHLLSFAMLFALTGIVFAFTTLPYALRLFLAPMVLVAQVLDIACWWLARLDTVGPTFALLIMATGGVVGLGLFLQIVLSLFTMYGPKGKVILGVLFFAGLGGLTVVGELVVRPTLQFEREEAAKAKLDAALPPPKATAERPTKPEPKSDPADPKPDTPKPAEPAEEAPKIPAAKDY